MPQAVNHDDVGPFLPPRTTAITTNWLSQATTVELQAATMQYECAELDAHREAICIAISPATPAMRDMEMRIYGSTPNRRRRRLGAPWLPHEFRAVVTTKCDSMRYELRCGVHHQSDTNYAAVFTHQFFTDTLWCLHTKLYSIC